jgi:hypothetical protein
MAENLSLADRAIQALSAVAAIGEGGMGLDRPERHAVRNIKQEAETILSEAFIRAIGLAYLAKDLPEIVNAVRDEEAKKKESV